MTAFYSFLQLFPANTTFDSYRFSLHAQKLGVGGIVGYMVVSHNILETAQRPNSFFPLLDLT